MISPKIQKATLITIIVLLVIFIPLTGASVYFKYIYHEPVVLEPENVNHELHFNGKLWFYNDSQELLGTYTCEHTYCDIGKNVKTLEEYSLNSYHNTEETELPIIQNQFVFLKDTDDEKSEELFLYQIPTSFAYKNVPYLAVKDYGLGLTNHFYILENQEHKFGVMEIFTAPLLAIPYDYDFIGVLNKTDESGLLIADYFIALKGHEWLIVAKNGGELTQNIEEEIVDFNGEYVITKSKSGFYHIIDYLNNPIVSTDFISLSFANRFLVCVTDTEYYLMNILTRTPVSEIHSITSEDKIETEVKDSTIKLKVNGEVLEEITI